MKSHFSINELLRKCSAAERAALCSSPSLSLNLCRLTLALEGIRAYLQLPLIVTSSYRDYAHNKAVGGVPESQHLTCSAADITCKSMPSLIEAVKSYQQSGGILGQVIVYSNFIHVALAEACEERTREYKFMYN